MGADEFVALLENSAPEVSALVAYGLTKKEAMEMRETYVCKKRPKPIAAIPGSDPIAELINTWDLGKVEVGMVAFRPKPISHPKGFEIAQVEIDPLVFSPTAGLFVEERDVPGHIVWHVAKDGESFLNALAKVLSIAQPIPCDDELDNPHDLSKEVEHCALAAVACPPKTEP